MKRVSGKLSGSSSAYRLFILENNKSGALTKGTGQQRNYRGSRAYWAGVAEAVWLPNIASKRGLFAA